MEQKEQSIQWHPAFLAGMQIELGEEANHLSFESEHQLGTKPMAIDILIKKEKEREIKKNIGQIFRTYNVIEYKSPRDYLSVDDFYKVYGYACFYKSDSANINSILIEELTITLVSIHYPRKLIDHLKSVRKYRVCKKEKGIYYVYGDKIPIQILVTSQLDEEENLWLRSLTNNLHESQMARKLLTEYQKHEKNVLYQSVMDVIVRANPEPFREEAEDMCEALMELMKDKFEEKFEEERNEGEKAGENRVNELNLRLSKAGRMEDMMRAMEDKTFQKQLFEEFGL